MSEAEFAQAEHHVEMQAVMSSGEAQLRGAQQECMQLEQMLTELEAQAAVAASEAALKLQRTQAEVHALRNVLEGDQTQQLLQQIEEQVLCCVGAVLCCVGALCCAV